jgi:hypothetical protein
MFVPPEMKDLAINATWFTPILLGVFTLIVVTPFILYKKM